jgi:Protein of unknown function DUF262
MDISGEVEKAKRSVSTDAYQMSFGEVVNLYQEDDLIINPEFQRLFRWSNAQKSRLIESMLLGIPIPPIFVYELPEGKWELVDGLQRISTVLEFIGVLRDGESNKILPPSILSSTHYLPSLNNVVWERSEMIRDCPLDAQAEIGKVLQLSIRRSRIGVEILKRPSDAHTKYDLFQRLNSGGSIANAQELRNCVAVMTDSALFRRLREVADYPSFVEIIQSTEEQKKRQRNIEYLMRFLAYRYIPYDGKMDVEEYVTSAIIEIAEKQIFVPAAEKNFDETFNLLGRALGADALKRFSDGRFSGRVGLTALETVAVGVSFNLERIRDRSEPEKFVAEKIRALWDVEDLANFSRAGVTGTQRIQKSIPFGRAWFRPS